MEIVEGTDETRTPAEEDAKVETAVLHQLLALHPAQLTLEELVREIGGGLENPGERDAIERAVRDLAGAGLLHRSGELLQASRAAVRLDELLG